MFLSIIISLIVVIFLVVCFCIFFDHAVFTRKGTIYRVRTKDKKIALTFDDGPSPIWTPLILDELKKAQITATFFMIGHHVRKYPDIAQRVAREGHGIGNHGYAHSVLIYYTPEEIEEEIKYTEHVIKEVTGLTTKFFRPPKAWLSNNIKNKIKSLGYEVVLWSINSKDWVSFHHKNIVTYVSHKMSNGDIILFHDSGNVFSREGGDRSQTIKSIPLLAKALKEKGFSFVTIEELIYG